MRAWLFGVLGLVLAAPACASDHSGLAKGSHGGSAGRVNAEGGTPIGSGGALTMPGQGGTTGSGGRLPDESPGENVLTFVHGVVDAGPLLICFGNGAGSDATPVGVPEPSDGLAYGASWVVRTVDGVDWQRDDLSTWIITGELSSLAGLDCAEALAHARAVAEPESSAGGAGGPGVLRVRAAKAAVFPARPQSYAWRAYPRCQRERLR